MAQHVEAVSVLVLDDHRFMLQIHRAILTSLGIPRVTLTSSINEALDHIRNEPFDLVIADYRLFGESGAEFIRLVRRARDGIDRFTPVIACTADTTAAIIQELRDAGADEVLAKPVSAKAICDKINTVVYSRRPFVNSPKFFGPDRRRRAASRRADERRHDGRHGEANTST